MKKKLLFIALLILSVTSVLFAQNGNNSSRGVIIKNEAPNNRKLDIDNSIVNNLYASLSKKVLETGNVETMAFTFLDIQKYLNLFELDIISFKEVNRDVAEERITAEVANAKVKLKSINNSKNLTLVDTETFYGDDSKLSKVISYKIDIVDKNSMPKLYEVIFIEIDGVYKVMAIN